VLGPVYLEGTYAEVYPEMGEDEEGLRRFFKQFSFPGGIGSHCTPELPGSIHEGGELGYSLSHAFGAAFDNPDLLVTVAVGDGEAETGPLATAWHSSKFLHPIRDGAVLPVLHLNGYKINNPTLLARIPQEELEQLFRGYGWTPYLVEGHEPMAMHRQMADVLEQCLAQIRSIQQAARASGRASRAHWPMIVLRTPKGWTGPKEVDGRKVEGSWRSHQVPLSGVHDNPAQHHLQAYAPGAFHHGPVSLCEAANLSPLSRPAPPGAGPRPGEMRRLLSLPHGLPGQVHHRGVGGKQSVGKISPGLSHRPAALHLLRLLR
jgi:xylulose-5-phosphate/fructose-6-phosphate phosphoketolase